MTTMTLTQVYLEPVQKKALTKQAKSSGKSVSELMRDAVDAALLGVTTDDLKSLEAASKSAKADIDAMLTTLQANSEAHASFMAQIKALQEAD
jgi:hypothetical protein